MLIGGQSHAATGTVQDRRPAPSGSAEVLVDGAVLRGLLCGKREARGDFIFGCAGLHDAGCYVFSYRWAVLEAVTRAAAYEPDICEIRVLVNQKITVGSALVLADARFDDGRILQGGEAAGDEFARGFDGGYAGDAGLRIGIYRRAVVIVGDFQAAIFQVGHAVEFVL